MDPFGFINHYFICGEGEADLYMLRSYSAAGGTFVPQIDLVQMVSLAMMLELAIFSSPLLGLGLLPLISCPLIAVMIITAIMAISLRAPSYLKSFVAPRRISYLEPTSPLDSFAFNIAINLALKSTLLNLYTITLTHEFDLSSTEDIAKLYFLLDAIFGYKASLMLLPIPYPCITPPYWGGAYNLVLTFYSPSPGPGDSTTSGFRSFICYRPIKGSRHWYISKAFAAPFAMSIGKPSGPQMEENLRTRFLNKIDLTDAIEYSAVTRDLLEGLAQQRPNYKPLDSSSDEDPGFIKWNPALSDMTDILPDLTEILPDLTDSSTTSSLTDITSKEFRLITTPLSELVNQIFREDLTVSDLSTIYPYTKEMVRRIDDYHDKAFDFFSKRENRDIAMAISYRNEVKFLDEFLPFQDDSSYRVISEDVRVVPSTTTVGFTVGRWLSSLSYYRVSGSARILAVAFVKGNPRLSGAFTSFLMEPFGDWLRALMRLEYLFRKDRFKSIIRSDDEV